MLQVDAPLQDVGIALILLPKGVLPCRQAVVQQQPKGEHIHCRGEHTGSSQMGSNPAWTDAGQSMHCCKQGAQVPGRYPPELVCRAAPPLRLISCSGACQPLLPPEPTDSKLSCSPASRLLRPMSDSLALHTMGHGILEGFRKLRCLDPQRHVLLPTC